MRSRAITAFCTALAGIILAGIVLTAAGGTPARADEPGFSVRVTAPDTFSAGRAAQTVTAVATSENRRCRKVRWALLIRSGIDAGQVEVVRVEDDGAFGATRRTEGRTTTVVDDALDPGTLCRGRTVTARWQIAFTGPDAGDVQLEARAFDARDTLLTTAGAGAEVRGGSSKAPSPSPSADAPEEEAAPAPAPEDTTGAAAPPAGEKTAAAGATELTAGDTTLLGPGLIIGGVFVFLGVLLLFRIRVRSREARRQAQMRPTGFYTMPGSSR